MSATPQKRRLFNVQAGYAEPAKPIFWAFLIYILSLYLQAGYRNATYDSLKIEFILGLLLSGVALTRFGDIKNAANKGLFGWTVALLLCMGLMVVASHDIGYSWDVYWNHALKYAIYGFAIAGLVTSPRNLRWFMAFFLLAFFKMGEEGMLGTITGGLIWENQDVLRLHGPTPNYVHPNSFSGTQLGTFPYLFYLMPLAPWWLRGIMLLQVIFCGNILLRAGSRTTYVGLVFAVAAMIMQARRRFLAALLVIGISIMAIPMLPAQYVGRFSSIFEDKSEVGADTSIGARKQILVDAIDIFEMHPFGVGVGAFPLVRKETFGREQDTHNLYLEVATNMGVHGLVIFAGFLIALGMSLRHLSKRMQVQLKDMESVQNKTPEQVQHVKDLELILACTRATWIFLVIRLAVGLFGMDMYEVYWWFMFGIIAAMYRINVTAELRTKAFVEHAAAAKAGTLPQQDSVVPLPVTGSGTGYRPIPRRPGQRVAPSRSRG